MTFLIVKPNLFGLFDIVTLYVQDSWKVRFADSLLVESVGGVVGEEVESCRSRRFVSGSVDLRKWFEDGISSTRRVGVLIGLVRVRRCSLLGIRRVRRCCSIWSLVIVFDEGVCSSEERFFFRWRGVGERERARDFICPLRSRIFGWEITGAEWVFSGSVEEILGRIGAMDCSD